MADLLIHSVSEFSDLILEALKLAEARTIVEIGAEYGGMSALLAEHCRALGDNSPPSIPRRNANSWIG